MLNQPGLRAINLQKARLLERVHNRNPGLANEIRALKLDWYTIRNQATELDKVAEQSEIYIYDEIGGSFGVGALDFIEELNALETPEVVVRINSPGGLLVDGVAIASAIAQHPSKIITRVDGIAASIASIIAIAGDECEMCDGSQMMIHDALCNIAGNANECRETADWLDAQSANIASMYAKKAGGTKDEWRARMLAETWMFAGEAVEIGLANSIYARNKKPITATPPAADDDSIADDIVAEDMAAAQDLDALMHKPHRLTNRGYRYLGRDKAPTPGDALNSISDDEIDRFVNAATKVLGR